MDKKIRINNQIRVAEVRVIDDLGVNLGVISTAEGIRLAESKGLDLIEISPNIIPPIAKIMDYGKFQYLENKKQKLAKSKIQTVEIKNIQIGIATSDHDLELKAKNASEFLKEGNKLRVILTLRGREKYLDRNFLKERANRLLKLLTEEYKLIDDLKPAQRGLGMTIEKAKK
ncbi:MAG: translation initiation factor IF-3 [bacterium]